MRLIAAYMTMATLIAAPAPEAGDIAQRVRLQNVTIEREGDVATVSFQAETDRRSVRQGETLVLAPVITDGENRVSLPEIVVRNARGRALWSRHEMAAGESAEYDEGRYIRSGEKVNYREEVSWQRWMEGANLDAQYVLSGACSDGTAQGALIAGIDTGQEPEQVPQPDTVRLVTGYELQGPPATNIADTLARIFPFVLPASEFRAELLDSGTIPITAFELRSGEHGKFITVYFEQDKWSINERYRSNGDALQKLASVVEIIEESGISIERVIVAGFASPEGPFDRNDRLAWERAVSVKEYLMRNTKLSPERISLYNGSADWSGLRSLIVDAKDMPMREEVLEIIDNNPIWDSSRKVGLTSLIRNYHNGEPYAWMAKHLFPFLRCGSFIRVYYDDRP